MSRAPQAPNAIRRAMLATNVRQKDYYESRYEAGASGRGADERAANGPTRAWTRLRRRIQRLRAASGVDAELIALHRAWLGDIKDKRVLDLGCFSGNQLSLWMAESAAEYVGVDLSDLAIAELNQKLRSRGLVNARGVTLDFLANDWPEGYFDVVYAYSVLHHFANLDVALAELQRIVKPGGVVISMDPMATEPFNRLARSLFRPFQTDRAWEFPFTFSTFDTFRHYFDIAEVQGLQGTVKLAYPLLLLPGSKPLGHAIASRLAAWDWEHARSFGLPFYMCWHVAMKLRSREVPARSQESAAPAEIRQAYAGTS